MYVNDVSSSCLHALSLLAEGAEDIFHQTPVEECSILVHPHALKACEVAYLCQWLLGGGYESFFLVEV